MKVKTKIKAKTALVKKTAHAVDLTISKVSEEWLPMLFGMHILWNVDPAQYVNNLAGSFRVNSKAPEELSNILRLSGYIYGPDNSWKFTKKVYELASKHLLKHPAFEQKPGLNASEGPPLSMMALSLEYRKLLKQQPKEFISSKLYRVAPKMRILCRKYDSRHIGKQMAPFFATASQTGHDYSIEAFEKFLEHHKQINRKDGW